MEHKSVKTEEPREFTVYLLDRFGNSHVHKVHQYEYSNGNLQLFRSSIGVIVELIEDTELRKANMELIALFLDIGGFWLEGEENGEA